MRKILFSILTLALTFILMHANVSAENAAVNSDEDMVAFSYVILNED